MTMTKSDRHIHFDLSKNQTYIIDTNNYMHISAIEYISSITILTSFIFITNTSLAYSKKKYIYAALFLALTITSLIYRYNVNTYTLFIDKTIIFLIFIYGSYMLFNNINRISTMYFLCIMTTVVATFILYYYGYLNNCFCFDADSYISENYMALMHIVGSIGHNMIILI